MKISIDELKEAVAYDPDTGLFTWLESRRGHRKAGDEAGSPYGRGYRRVKISQVTYAAHRLAFAFVYDRWPVDEIDHINGVRSDNRISNLREATRAQNCKNVPGKGVRFEADRGKWLARISVNGRQKNLGRYPTEAEAVAVFKAAKIKYFGEFASERV